MAHTTLYVRGFTRTADPELFKVDYDVVVVHESRGPTTLASTDHATIRIGDELAHRALALFAELGRRMEVSVGLSEALAEPENTPEEKEEEL